MLEQFFVFRLTIKKSQLEDKFLKTWNMLVKDIPLESQYTCPGYSEYQQKRLADGEIQKISSPVRADYAHLASRTLIEIQGGTFLGVGHTGGNRYEADCYKNLSALSGSEEWVTISLTPNMFTKKASATFDMIKAVITRREAMFAAQGKKRKSAVAAAG